MARRLGARDYRCAAERIRAGAALARGEGFPGAAARLEAALARPAPGPGPARGLEVRPAPRDPAAPARRRGRRAAAFAEAARAVRTIAAGTRDEGLRDGFLALPLVREVLEEATP